MERIKQKLEEARKQRERLQDGHSTSTDGVMYRKRHAYGSVKNRLFTINGNNIWLLSGMSVVIVSGMIAWWIVSGLEMGEIRLSDLDLIESHQTSATGTPDVEKLEARITDLTERVEMLTDSITPEPPVIADSAQVFERLPPPAAGHTGREANAEQTPWQATAGLTTRPRDTTVIAPVATTVAPPHREPDRAVPDAPASPARGTDTVKGEQSRAHKPLRTAASNAAVMERPNPVTKKQPAVSVAQDGPWVINLVSSRSKADADRFTKKARSRDIQTDQQQVTVKGKQYWRVQITGFSTAGEARAYADSAKEKLGLEDVWIMTR